MFGYRPDGCPIPQHMDPIVLFTPYIMTTRNDAQNFVTYPIEYKPMADYIRNKRNAEVPISFMTILIAAYVRAVGKHPQLNRFVVGKRAYMHKDIVISYVVLRETNNGELDEAVVKLKCTPDDTILSIARRLNEQVRVARQPSNKNGTVDFARRFLKIPFLPGMAVGFLKMLDRFGLMPRKVIDVSPFHCSLFVTNMMSINLPTIYHHLYNFGTCSIFLSLGRPERLVTATNDGKAVRKLMLPLGAVCDERVCGGASYAEGMRTLQHYMLNPELLEWTPEEERRRESEQKQATGK
ncbi:MAG TPA: 2-oxo acid dehydrogenase subunit E2 [Candidatus Pullichristensenella excrementigallinarum]|uniref:2-oxo acid dehydrogenase subunit E2 n=1 Tax=Candidatus Pullichristensenella excrementigallinarum TaxID=2840907 RepID=A0A9D1LC82_9FIRM|nr:2-oxo acid dehydrogenase subunit E2 [Candidatus Pullichristensenella excrementigallinarum]